MTTVTIYRLLDPETREVVYIGQSVDVQKRFKQHCDPGKFNSSVMCDWKFSISMKIVMEIIEETTKEKADQREKYHIKLAWVDGQPLLNNPSSIGVERKFWRKRLRDCKWNQIRKRLFYFVGKFDTDKELGFNK